MPENQNQFKCTGNCMSCLPQQRAYCACQHAYSNMRVLDKMMENVITLQGAVDELSKRIEALQNNEADIFDPNESENEENSEIPKNPTTQEGDGVK